MLFQTLCVGSSRLLVFSPLSGEIVELAGFWVVVTDDAPAPQRHVIGEFFHSRGR